MKIKTKACPELIVPITKKAIGEDGSLTIEGYASTVGKDRHGDVITADAWGGEALKNYVKNPIILAFHNHDKPIGKMVDYSITENGLFIKASISSAAKDVFGLIEDGVLSTFSVGIRVLDADYDSNTDIFVIKELELYEISVVAIPAQADATFTISKQLRDQMIEESKKEFSNSDDEEIDMDKIKELEDKIKELQAQSGTDNADLIKSLQDTIKTLKKELEDVRVSVGKSGAEKLQEDLEKRVADILTRRDEELAKKSEEEKIKQEHKEFKETLDSLKDELTSKAEELESLRKSKMRFQQEGAGGISDAEKDNAVMVAKLLNKDIKDTKLGKQLLEKAGSDNNVHIPTSDWEQTFSQRIYNDIRQRLVVASMFNSVPMNSLQLHIPINPDPAADATWVARTDYGTTSSSGVEKTSALSEVIMKAHKLATHEYLMDEEDEDSIIAVAGIIRDSMARRMGRTLDKAFLRGANNEAGGDPINGLTTVANTGSAEVTLSGTLATSKVTVADLQAARRKLGVWGLDPTDVMYVVSTDAYYDLLEDNDFRTVDVVGSNATILRGQIATVNGSPVMVSGEFATKAINVPCVVAVNASAFLSGDLRTARFERDREVINQREVLVASTRIGFANMIAGKGSASLLYPAS